MVKKSQFKIQQMAFMLIAVFFFFVLVGLFFINIQLRSLRGSAVDLKREKAITSLKTIAEMPEIAWTYTSYCDYMCLDEDKILVLAGFDYGFWPVDSIEIRKVYPYNWEEIECPAEGCNYYNIYESGKEKSEVYSTYVSLCKRISNHYDKCEIAKLLVGIAKDE